MLIRFFQFHRFRPLSLSFLLIPRITEIPLAEATVSNRAEQLERVAIESTADDGRLVRHGDLLCRRFVPLPLPGEQHEGAPCQQVAEEHDPGEDQGEVVPHDRALRKRRVHVFALEIDRGKKHLYHHHVTGACNEIKGDS